MFVLHWFYLFLYWHDDYSKFLPPRLVSFFCPNSPDVKRGKSNFSVVTSTVITKLFRRFSFIPASLLNFATRRSSCHLFLLLLLEEWCRWRTVRLDIFLPIYGFSNYPLPVDVNKEWLQNTALSNSLYRFEKVWISCRQLIQILGLINPIRRPFTTFRAIR